MPVWTAAFFLLFLLLTGSTGFSGISSFKTTLLYVLATPALIYGLVRLLIRRPERFSVMQFAALCYLGFSLLSAAFSPHGSQAWYSEINHEGAVTICFYVLLYLTVANTGRLSPWLSIPMLIGMAAFCLISLLQLIGGNPFSIYPLGLDYKTAISKHYGGFLGTMGNIDLVSTFLCMMIPLLTFVIFRRRGWQRWVAVLIDLAALVILIWIDVLSGIVGLAGGAFLTLLLLFMPKSRRGKIWLFSLLGLLLVLVLVLLRLWDPPVNMFHEIHEILNGRITDKMGSGRIYIWRQMLERVPDRLLLGTGPDTVRLTGLQPFITYDAAGTELRRAAITDGHCLPIHILYCQGLPALLSWLVMSGAAVITWVRGRKSMAVAALGSAVMCWQLSMLFCFSSVILTPFFWIALGLMEAEAARLRTAPKG